MVTELPHPVARPLSTVFTTRATVTVAVPDTPPPVGLPMTAGKAMQVVLAVIVAVPFATAVTSPDVLTVAMLESDDDQAKVLPGPSGVVAVNCTVSPTDTSVLLEGVTVTVSRAISGETSSVGTSSPQHRFTPTRIAPTRARFTAQSVSTERTRCIRRIFRSEVRTRM